MYPDAPKEVLETWRNLGPLSIVDVIQNSQLFLNFDADQIEFKREEFDTAYIIGFFIKGTQTRYGICRRITKTGQIQEGNFKNSDLNGYARVIYTSGNYYIGDLKTIIRMEWVNLFTKRIN